MTSATPALPRVFLLAGRDRRVSQGHPWVYSNEIRMDEATRELPGGCLVTLHRVDGKALGVGTFNPHCLISFRIFSRDADTVIDRAFFADRLHRALALRRWLYGAHYFRMVHGDADGLPGLVIDRFNKILVVQTSTAGMDSLLDELLAALEDTCEPSAVILHNKGVFRRLEGLEEYVRIAKGAVNGPIEVREGDFTFLADPLGGQKTGWFYDQRDNRAFVAGLAGGGRLLDVYCYGGGFAISAAAGGADSSIGIDRSAGAIELARQAAELNGVADICEFIQGDAFGELERLTASGERFHVVVADPPAFVKSRKDLKSGLRGYRKLARHAAAAVKPGGFLFLASCSHNVSADQFAGEVAGGIARAGRTGRVIRTAGAGPDHPLHPMLPESSYLKSLVLQLD